MACGLAVKRPLEFGENSSPSPHDADCPASNKRARTSLSSHCSPFRPAAFGVAHFAASLPTTTTGGGGGGGGRSAAKKGAGWYKKDENGPFATAAASVRIGEEQLDTYLRAEVRHLRRRRLIARRGNAEPTGDGDTGNNALRSYRAPRSPTANNGHSSDSDNENPTVATAAGGAERGPESAAAASSSDIYSALAEKKQFSLNQVQLICQRLLQEQETRLRSEYEIVLNHKLQEQYETFCQFTDDQIRRKYDEGAECPSYLS